MKGLVLMVLGCVATAGYCQEHVRVLEHNTTYTIYNNITADIEHHSRIEILSEQGYHLSVYRDYFDKFRKITDITVDIFDHSGKKVKRLRRGDGIEFGLSPSYEISDVTELIIDPKYKQYPFVVEVNASLKLDGFISMPTWVPRPEFHTAVKESRLIVIRPESVKINFREEHIKGVTQTKENRIVTSYLVSNLPAVDKKMRYRDFYDDQPKVLISPEKFKLDNVAGSAATWADFGDWFLSLNSDKYQLSAKTRHFIDGLDKGDKTKMVRQIYEYMQDRTRYVSIQLGIGGFKSLPVEVVDEHGYGDCKALTTYTKSMLEYAGIKSNFVLVRAGDDEPDVIADFTSDQFNHVYLGVPFSRDTVYLECTSQIAPTNYTGKFTDDRNVLWIDNKKSLIIRSRVYDHRVNTQNNFVDIKLDNQGSAHATFECFNQGIFFDEIMIYKMAPGDYVKQYNQSKFDYSDFALQKFSFDQPERDVSAFVSRFSVDINSMARTVNGKLVLPLVPVSPFYKYIEKDDLQKFYSIKRGMTIADEIELDIPENYWVYNIPGPEQIDSPFGNYKLEVAADGNKIKIKRTMVFYKGDHKGEHYDPFNKFFQAIQKVEKRKLVLNSKT